MLVRLVLLVALVGFVAAIVQALRGDPRLQVPARWRRSRSPLLRDAVDLRQSIARLIIRGAAEDLLEDVDAVVERMAVADELRGTLQAEAERAGDAAKTRVAEAVEHLDRELEGAFGWLQQAQALLLQAAADAVVSDATVRAADVRGELRKHAETLEQEVRARREIEAVLRR